MERIKEFEKPTQVRFKLMEEDGVETFGGIGFGGEIICGCCGGCFTLDEIYDDAEIDNIENPIEVLEWISISEEIKGE